MFAKHNAEADGKLVSILDKLSNDEREKERGSFYGSLSGLIRHILGGTIFFGRLFTNTLVGNAAASRALADITAMKPPPGGALSEAQWKDFTAALKAADSAYITLTGALNAGDLDAPVELDWYGGKPASVPLAFMLQQLTAHNIHHRGQISQILDELKIDNDYSGINVTALA
ncbi:MAG: damage-inducible protein DinB [Spirochaetaceae bacterium]|nr:damage-inducible protein DinB [Spirochaetaceae bacterium]